MIEIIYDETGQTGGAVVIKPPKNIRQIGSPKGRHKIYVEDYVYTFLHSSAFEGETQKRAAVLLGRNEVSQDIRYTFISGAVSCNDFVFGKEGIEFDEDCWDYIYKEMKRYFEHQEIVGWFLGLTGFPLELTPAIESAHRKYFAGRDKVLFLSEPEEREDVFFSYEQGILQKKEGYYIYYEKNLDMQEYMIRSKEKIRAEEGGIDSRAFWEPTDAVEQEKEGNEQFVKSGDEEEEGVNRETEAVGCRSEEEQQSTPAEQALRNYRSALLERQGNASPRKMNVFLYTAASAAMVILCVIGITTMNNYEKMQQVEQVLAAMARPSQQETEEEKEMPQQDHPEEPENPEVVVKNVPGEVAPEEQPSDEQLEGTQSSDEQSEGTQSSEVQSEEKSEEQQPEEELHQEQVEETQTQEQPTEAETSASVYLEQGYYIVQPGDKLELICKNIYQTTDMLDKICEVNHIEDGDKIYTGQKLILP